MWVGRFDFDNLEFVDEGTVYNFPRGQPLRCELLHTLLSWFSTPAPGNEYSAGGSWHRHPVLL